MTDKDDTATRNTGQVSHGGGKGGYVVYKSECDWSDKTFTATVPSVICVAERDPIYTAAPDMLEALREVVDTCRADCPAGLAALKSARAIIAKATGGAACTIRERIADWISGRHV